MVAEPARPPDDDDAHPLDWYPEPDDDPKGVPVEIVNQWVEETLTRREHGKIEGAPGDVGSAPRAYTTNLTREIVMPSHDTPLAPLAGMFSRYATELRAIAELLSLADVLSEREARRLVGRMKAGARMLNAGADLIDVTLPIDEHREEVKRVMQAAKVRRSRGAGAGPRVYFMQCIDCHLVKIGVSRDYRKRQDDLHRKTSHVLVVLGSFDGDRHAEAEVHALFKDDRVEGEWFKASDRLTAFIIERRTPPTGLPVSNLRRHRRP